jgi:hypothetical protein
MTYPRPVFDGRTPSAKAAVAARAWSAMTRKATSAGSCAAPYLRPDSPSTARKIGAKRSVS